MREVEDWYRALARSREPALPEVQSQYADYAATQRQSLRGGLSAELRYWRGALADAPPSRLPYDHRRDTRQMAPLHFHIAGTPARRLKDRARALHIGFFAMLFAAFQLSLARWSGEKHVTGAVSVADRFDARFSATLGYLITALPLHSRLEDSMTMDAFAQDLSQRLAAAYSHRNLSYELYDELYAPQQPFCPTLFNFIAIEPLGPEGDLQDGGLGLSPGPSFPRKLHHRELYFELMEFSRGLRGRVFYNTDFFARETVEKFVGRYAAMLERMASRPSLQIGRLS
jgi:non-ribosomal peptide synthetase component F